MRNRRLVLRALVIASAPWIIIGCGQSEQAAREGEAFTTRAKASAPGALLPSESQEVSAAVAEEPPAETKPTVIKPASLHAAVQVIDLRTFPVVEKAEEGGLARRRATEANYGSALRDVTRAAEFYRTKLTEAGWRALAEEEQLTPDSAVMTFTKQGFVVLVAINKIRPEGTLQVLVQNQGNVDTRKLPQFPGAKLETGTYAYTTYETPAKPEDVIEYVRDKLTQLGWQEFTSAGGNRAPKGFEWMGFTQGGMELSINVGRKRAGRTEFNYYARMLHHEIPTLADAKDVEFSDDPLSLRYLAPAELEKVVEFHRKELAALGWSPHEGGGGVEQGFATLLFDPPAVSRSANKEDAQPIKLEASRAGRGTYVQIARVRSDQRRTGQAPRKPPVEQPKTPPQRPDPPAQVAQQPPNKTPPAKEGAAQKPKAVRGLLAADVPVPEGALDLKRDEILESISFNSKLDAKQIAEFYRKKLKELGCREDAKESSTFDEFASLVFDKDDKAIRVFVVKGQAPARSRVTIDGDGVVWSPDKADEPPKVQADDEKLAAKEQSGLPIPEKCSSSMGRSTPYRRMVEGKVDASLKAVLAFYRHELPGRGWKESGTAKIKADVADLTFEGKDGPLTLQLGRKRGETTIELAMRDVQKAKKDGIAPAPGQARLLLGNAGDKEAIVIVNNKEYKLAPGQGANKDPSQAVKVDLKPGKHEAQIKVAGKSTETESFEIGADGTWGLIVLPDGGCFSDVVY